MTKTLFVSMPRSGHNLTYRVFSKYFGDGFTYCEQYSHCNVIPCPDNPLVQKDHDFCLETPIDLPDYNYIILWRNPIESITSHYTFDRVCYPHKPDTKDAWLIFVDRWLPYYVGWINKWSNHKNAVRYEELLDNPYQIWYKFINIITGNVDGYKLQSSIVETINKKHNIDDFKYYDKAEFHSLANKIQSLI